MKPLNVVQPEGPSFSVNGNEVAWQKWHFRVSFNYREGLVLHNVGCARICNTKSFCAPYGRHALLAAVTLPCTIRP